MEWYWSNIKMLKSWHFMRIFGQKLLQMDSEILIMDWGFKANLIFKPFNWVLKLHHWKINKEDWLQKERSLDCQDFVGVSTRINAGYWQHISRGTWEKLNSEDENYFQDIQGIRQDYLQLWIYTWIGVIKASQSPWIRARGSLNLPIAVRINSFSFGNINNCRKN